MKNNKRGFLLILSICTLIYFGRNILTIPDIIIGVVCGFLALYLIFHFLPEETINRIRAFKKNN